MSRLITVAVDIDGTLRDLETAMEKYLERDHPDKVDKFRELRDQVYRSLDPLFESKDQVYSWMFEERVFELFGTAGKMHPKVIDDLNIFTNVAKQNGFEVVISSVQRQQSVTATLYWLAKWGCKVQKIQFFDSFAKKVEAGYDINIDDSPEVLEAFVGQTVDGHPELPRAIKIPYGFTKDIDCPSLDIANGNFDDLYELLNIEKVLKT